MGLIVMNAIHDVCYVRTMSGEKSITDHSGLERRLLILLKLVDGFTPVATFEKHLSHFDIHRLFNDLISAGLITKVVKQTSIGGFAESFDLERENFPSTLQDCKDDTIVATAFSENTENIIIKATPAKLTSQTNHAKGWI